MECVRHLPDEAFEHLIRGYSLTLKVLQYSAIALSGDNIDGDFARLAEPPATANTLVVLLEGMRRESRNVVAALKIQTPSGNARFGDKSVDLPIGEC